MTLPFFLSFLVTLVVTVYVIKIIIKQENTITAHVNLPNRGVAGSSQPRLFSITQTIDNNVQHNNQILSENLEIRTPRNTTVNTNDPVLKESRKRELIRRDEANPHIFFRSLLHVASSHLILVSQVVRAHSPNSPSFFLPSGYRDFAK